MPSLLSTWRALASRAGTTAMILVVAVIAVGAATAGPTYYASSQESIVGDNLASADVLGPGYQIVLYGSVAESIAGLEADLPTATGSYGSLFAPPILSMNVEIVDAADNVGTSLDWRSGVCQNLAIAGSCPGQAGQILVSRSFSSATGLRIGSHLSTSLYGDLVVTGVYAAPTSPGTDYWFDHLGDYFPYENPCSATGNCNGTGQDAVFTPQSTFTGALAAAQGETSVDALLLPQKVTLGDVSGLGRTMSALADNSTLEESQATVTSDIPATLISVKDGWSSVAVPILLVTLQLLVLAWLLLFLLIGDAVAGRAADIALAKLRGQGRGRVALFGLSEPFAVLGAALPLGALCGWGATSLLGHDLLRPGTPSQLQALGWLAAAGATLGGLAAAVVASARTLRRPVIEQWRKSGVAQDRTWVVDSVLLTGALAGLGELFLGGRVSSAHRSALGLLVPGLLGLAVAVVASRLLPLACRLAGRQGRPRALAGFLAVRSVARRPGGPRTTIMLGASFALATFSLAGWSLEQANYKTVARADVGAPTVLQLKTTTGGDLLKLVHEADPGGREAAAVEEYFSNGTTTIAIDPSSWARVTGASGGLLTATTRLAPPEPPPLIVNGDSLRLSLTVNHFRPSSIHLTVDLLEAGASAPTPLDLGPLRGTGAVTLAATLTGCPCTVEDMDLALLPGQSATTFGGTLDVLSMETHDSSGWRAVGSGDALAPGNWTPTGSEPAPMAVDPSGGGGLAWTVTPAGTLDTMLSYADRPASLPAIASAAVTSGRLGPFTATGLDGRSLPVNVIATVPSVPGAPADGVVIDDAFAELAAMGNTSIVQDQVWLAPGASRSRIEAALEREGVTIVSTQTESGYANALTREGPGLAGVLFVAEAAVAAVLASGGAILGLYLTARRRRYELAALAASGLRRRTLVLSVAWEQLVVLLFGVLVGVGTGIVAAVIALRDIPQFLTPPTSPAIASFPPVGTLVGVVACAAGVVAVAALAGGVSLTRRLRLDQLREGPP